MTVAFVNSNVTYSAVATVNDASKAHSFSYVWSLDDSTSANTSTFTKQWASKGIHVATVTATDINSGESASASKSVSVVDEWVVSGSTIQAYTSINSGPYSIRISPETILIVGSSNTDPDIGNKCYIYNSTSQAITQTGSIPSSRVHAYGSSICQLADGRIFIDGAIS